MHMAEGSENSKLGHIKTAVTTRFRPKPTKSTLLPDEIAKLNQVKAKFSNPLTEEEQPQQDQAQRAIDWVKWNQKNTGRFQQGQGIILTSINDVLQQIQSTSAIAQGTSLEVIARELKKKNVLLDKDVD